MIRIKAGLWVLLVLSNFGWSAQPSAYVTKVEFHGNASLKAKQLLSVLELQEPWLFSYKEFDPRIQKLDAISLKTYYVSNGFLAASVRDSFTIEEDRATLYYTINEGKQYLLNSIDVRGNEAISDDDITDQLGLKIGKPFNPVRINAEMPALEELYQHHSKLYVSFDFIPDIKDSVNAVLKVVEGPDVSIERITFVEIDSSDIALVSRELVFEPEDYYTKKAIDDSKRRILETGLFSSSSIVPVLGTPTDSAITVKVQVKSFKDKRAIQSDGGFDKIEISDGLLPVPGLGGNLEWLNRSLFGSSNRLSSNISAELPLEEKFNYPRMRIDANLLNQWIGPVRIPTRLKGFFHLFKNFANLEGPFILRYGAQILTIHKFGDRSYIDFSLKWEKFVEPEEIIENVEQRKVDIHYRLDKTNHPFFPSKGSIVSVRLNGIGGILGGNREFIKMEIDGRNYISLFTNSVFAVRGNIGILKGWDENDEQYEHILYDKFYLGGSTNLRAWDPLEFAVETDSSGTTVPKGETHRIIINTEFRFPLYGLFGGVLFLDGGKLSNLHDWNSFTGMSWDSGFGFTIKTPLGPVRLDYARQMSDPSKWKIHLGVLYAF